MGLFGLVKKQFIDVIDWTESDEATLSFRYPMEDREIQNGGKLTVREGQMALFINEGEVADLFGPGLHTLTTKTLPIMTSLNNWDKLFASPFKSDVIFFNTREQLNQKWGTPQPITFRDKELGPIRIRAFGSYSYKLKNPKVFYQKVAGTKEKIGPQDLEGQLRATIVSSIGATIGNASVAFLDMAANQLQFSETLKTALAPALANYGLELQTFMVESITLPEEVQAYFDKASSMRVMGDLAKYAQFQAADSISTAAANSGGMAGMGAGLGAGAAIGQAMSGALGGLGASSQSSENPMDTINKLHELMTKGIITESEFNEKKTELLKKIR